MSDIVERLLNRAANAVIIKDKPNLYYDAAHEIERLRRDVKTAIMGDSAELADVKRANKMLRKALLYVYDNSLGLDPDKMTDNIEWVTAEIRAAREALESGE